jgi:MFS superfamily sulfate permease-like transporter
VLYTLLGSSRQLIVGPEGSIATLVAAAVLPLATAGRSAASELGGATAATLLVGAVALAARFVVAALPVALIVVAASIVVS